MSRAMSPVEIEYVLYKDPPNLLKRCDKPIPKKKICLFLQPGHTLRFIQSKQTGFFFVGLESKGLLYCPNCTSNGMNEEEWRKHVGALYGKLLQFSSNGNLEPAPPLKLWTHVDYCCEQTHTLACNCHKRTDWVLLGSFAGDLLKRLGFEQNKYDNWSLSKFQKLLKQDPGKVANALNISTVHWLLRSIDNAMKATVYAIFRNSTLIHTTEDIDTRLKLKPLEFECVCGLLETAGALCPITCTCQNKPPCFSKLKKIFFDAKRTCGIHNHSVICRCRHFKP